MLSLFKNRSLSIRSCNKVCLAGSFSGFGNNINGVTPDRTLKMPCCHTFGKLLLLLLPGGRPWLHWRKVVLDTDMR